MQLPDCGLQCEQSYCWCALCCMPDVMLCKHQQVLILFMNPATSFWQTLNLLDLNVPAYERSFFAKMINHFIKNPLKDFGLLFIFSFQVWFYLFAQKFRYQSFFIRKNYHLKVNFLYNLRLKANFLYDLKLKLSSLTWKQISYSILSFL